ncbi:MAG: DUF3575 domain-containing protein [Alistipes sp.]|nr:DUF3575 domain-containing protein [Alistipes sp.]
MKYYCLSILISLLALMNVHDIHAQDFTRICEGGGIDKFQPIGNSVVESFAIYYWRDRIDIDENYLDNRRQTDHIKEYLARSPHIDSIAIYAYASPEGVYEHNVWLARKRAEAARRYIIEHLGDDAAIDPDRIILRPMAENWVGLREEIEANYHRADRDRVLAILDAPVGNDTKKWRLQQLDNGYTYDYIIRRHMPELRVATWICVWEHPAVKLEPLAGVPASFGGRIAPQPTQIELPKVTRSIEPLVEPQRDKRTILALKTNLLYDAATWLNFAVEVPIARRFSILYEHHCPWWVTDSNKFCLEFLSFGGEFRWWFSPRFREASADLVKRDALVGHFVGLYGWGGKFDLQAKRTGCYQGEFFSVGVTYGYSMPICKRLNLEFSISAGYARIPHRHYIPTDDWSLLVRDRSKSGTWNYFGPTKVEIALVCPILCNYTKKGGRR